MTTARALLSALSFALIALACAPPPMDSRRVVDAHGVVPDLVCPGAIGCEDADGPLRVGAAARAITPLVEAWVDANDDGVRDADEPFEDRNGNGRWDPVWIAGFDPGRAATGVHDDTWARALTVSRGATRLGVVALDLLGVSHDDVVRLRLAAREAGLDLDYVMVVATHTHETQDPLGFGGAHLVASGYDPAYNRRVIDASVEALAEAIDREREARLSFAQTAEAGELIGDSREPIVVDPTLTALRFHDAESTIATLVVFGNHAEALGGDNTSISSDFPHYLRLELERAYPGSLAFFLPGALGGLMNPMDIAGCPDEQGNETCATGTFEKAEYVGVGAARHALEALGSAEVMDDPALELRVRSTLLRVTTPELLGAVQLGVVPRALYRTDGTRVVLEDEPTAPLLPLDEIVRGTIRIQTEVSAVRLGPLAILGLPGEIYPELWLDRGDGLSLAERPFGADYPFAPIPPSFQSVMPREAIRVVVNQANDAIGYIVPRTQWDRLPPRAYVDEGQYGEGVSLGSHVADDLFEAAAALYALEPR